MKIGVKDILEVTPEKPRAVPVTDRRQVETVSVLCSIQNRLNPDLPFKYGVKREFDRGIFWILGKYKEGEAKR